MGFLESLERAVYHLGLALFWLGSARMDEDSRPGNSADTLCSAAVGLQKAQDRLLQELERAKDAGQ